MERNGFSSGDTSQGQTGGSTSSGLGNSGITSGTQGFGANADTSIRSEQGQELADRARDVTEKAKDKLADVTPAVRERAGNIKDSVADALASGADRLRQRGSRQFVSSTTSGNLSTDTNARVVQVADRVATGMDATADWLREADLDTMKLGVERQVKEHPGRTLLMAVGVGYLLGKAFRK